MLRAEHYILGLTQYQFSSRYIADITGRGNVEFRGLHWQILENFDTLFSLWPVDRIDIMIMITTFFQMNLFNLSFEIA